MSIYVITVAYKYSVIDQIKIYEMQSKHVYKSDILIVKNSENAEIVMIRNIWAGG